MKQNKCKICRRVGVKLFLKAEKCMSVKCPMVKRPYPPGIRSKQRRRNLSEYAKQLNEKQKLRNWYNLRERQFKSCAKYALDKRGKIGNAQDIFIGKLEKRLDNVVFRLGFACSRVQARQLVSHKHFLVNGKRVNISSYQVDNGDEIQISAISQKNIVFQNLSMTLEKHQPPSWLKLDSKNLKGKVIGEPSFAEVAPPAEVSAIFEFYSR